MRTPIHIPQNFPFRVNFAGLRGTTLDMQSNGWELAVEQNHEHYIDAMQFRVAGRHHKLNLRLVSGILNLERGFIHEALQRGGGSLMNYFEHLEIPIAAIGQRVEMIVYGKPDFRAVNFEQFGMRELDLNNIRRFTLDELGVFKTFGNETEIILPEKKLIDVQEYLKEIIASQEDKQKEIRQRILREGERNLNKDHFSNDLEQAPKLRLVGY